MAVLQTFASEAQRKLDSGDAESASSLLEDGLRVYPDYTTAYVVLVRAYECLNDIESAFEVIQRGLKRFPSHRVFKELDAEFRPKALETHPRAATVPAEIDSNSKIAGVSEPELNSNFSAIEVESLGSAEAESVLNVDSPSLQELPSAVVKAEHSDSLASGAEPNSAVQSSTPPSIPVKLLPDDPDVLLDDGLSNIDDDNDNWTELREIVEDDSSLEEIPLSEDATTTEDVEQDEDGDSEGDASHESVDTHSVLKRINVVDGAVVVDKSLLKRLRRSANAANLRLLDTSSDKNSKRSLRSSNLRLVPGLEFTPLRVQSVRKQHVRTHYLPEAPSFPVIRGSEMNVSPAIAAPPIPKEAARRKKAEGEKKVKSEPKRTQLEELAARLERARIPVITEEPEPGLGRSLSSDASEPMVISETMAGIYEQQGLYDQAIKAYRQLARIKPEKMEYFEQKIAQLAKKPD